MNINNDDELNKRFEDNKRMVDAGNVDWLKQDFIDGVINGTKIDAQKMEVGDRRSYENYEAAKKASVGVEKVSHYAKRIIIDPKYQVRSKKIVATVFAGLSIAIAGGVLVTNTVDSYKLDDAVKDTVGYISASEHTIDAHDPANPGAYFYDTSAIARDIVNTDDFEDNVYGVYYRFKENRVNVEGSMDEVFSKCNLYTDEGYASFSDYLKSKGLVDENGNIDLDKYNAQAAMELMEREKGKAK